MRATKVSSTSKPASIRPIVAADVAGADDEHPRADQRGERSPTTSGRPPARGRRTGCRAARPASRRPPTRRSTACARRGRCTAAPPRAAGRRTARRPALSSCTSRSRGQAPRGSRRRAATAPPLRGTQTCASAASPVGGPSSALTRWARTRGDSASTACGDRASRAPATCSGSSGSRVRRGTGADCRRRGRGAHVLWTACGERTGVRTSRLLAVLVAGRAAERLRRRRLPPRRPVPARCPRALRPEVGPPTSQAPVPGDPAQPESGDDGRRPERRRLRPERADRAGRPARRQRDRRRAGDRPAAAGLPRPVAGARADDRARASTPPATAACSGWRSPPPTLEDGLLYAYLSTATDNRVVRFPLGGTPEPGADRHPARRDRQRRRPAVRRRRHAVRRHRRHRQPGARPPTPHSLAGKVLRIDTFGRAVGASPVYSRGHRDVTALCQGAATRRAAVRHRRRPATGRTSSTRSPRAATTAARRDAARWPRSAPTEGGLGGCAAAAGGVFLGAMDGQRVHALTLDGNGAVTGDPEEFLGGPVRPAAHRRPRRRRRAVDHHVQPRRRRHAGRGRRPGAAHPAADHAGSSPL